LLCRLNRRMLGAVAVDLHALRIRLEPGDLLRDRGDFFHDCMEGPGLLRTSGAASRFVGISASMIPGFAGEARAGGSAGAGAVAFSGRLALAGFGLGLGSRHPRAKPI
jgi:hypothetical protein